MRRSSLIVSALAASAVTVALSGCAGDEPSGDGQRSGEDSGQGVPAPDGPDGPDAPEVPAECLDTYIGLLGPADLAEVRLLPPSWPDPPVPATLCVTKETGDGAEVAEYATDEASEAVLDGYEQALLAAGAQVSREDSGTGSEVLSGTLEAVEFQVSTREGAFKFVLATA